MINNFEDFTHELTDYEIKTVAPWVVKGLSFKIGSSNAITNRKMCDMLLKRKNIKVTGPRMRKIIHAIRMSGVIERLVATSKGYYIENDMGELSKYIESLLQRSESIERIAKQLDFQRKQYINK